MKNENLYATSTHFNPDNNFWKKHPLTNMKVMCPSYNLLQKKYEEAMR